MKPSLRSVANDAVAIMFAGALLSTLAAEGRHLWYSTAALCVLWPAAYWMNEWWR